MSYVDETAAWIELFRTAYTTLRPEQFRTWLIGVGLEGSDAERLRKGREIYQIIRGTPAAGVEITIDTTATGVTYPRKNDG